MTRALLIVIWNALVPASTILAALMIGAYIYERHIRNDH